MIDDYGDPAMVALGLDGPGPAKPRNSQAEIPAHGPVITPKLPLMTAKVVPAPMNNGRAKPTGAQRYPAALATKAKDVSNWGEWDFTGLGHLQTAF